MVLPGPAENTGFGQSGQIVFVPRAALAGQQARQGVPAWQTTQPLPKGPLDVPPGVAGRKAEGVGRQHLWP
jgi:hypothetical protein